MTKKFFGAFLLLALVVTLSGFSGCGAKKQADEGETISGSIEDLVKLGKSIKCDVGRINTEVGGSTTYISGNKARSDFEIKDATGKMTTGHFILDGSTMYSWTDADKTQAMKINISDMEKLGANTQGSNEGSDNYKNKMDYKCKNWKADNSIFVPPTDINFSDFSQLINQLQGKLPAVNSNASTGNLDTQSLCSTCDKMPSGEGKTQCRKSLGCN